MEMNPEGNTLELAPEAAAVPFPYGAPVVIGTGTTVAVLMITTGLLLEAAAASTSLGPDAAATGAAVSVTVTVERAIVTVTAGGQLLAPPVTAAPSAPLAAAPPASPPELPVDAGRTVIYLVDVEVPVIVVVGPPSEVATPSAPEVIAAPPEGNVA